MLNFMFEFKYLSKEKIMYVILKFIHFQDSIFSGYDPGNVNKS